MYCPHFPSRQERWRPAGVTVPVPHPDPAVWEPAPFIVISTPGPMDQLPVKAGGGRAEIGIHLHPCHAGRAFHQRGIADGDVSGSRDERELVVAGGTASPDGQGASSRNVPLLGALKFQYGGDGQVFPAAMSMPPLSRIKWPSCMEGRNCHQRLPHGW